MTLSDSEIFNDTAPRGLSAIDEIFVPVDVHRDNYTWFLFFYATARHGHRLYVRLSVRHTLAVRQN